MATSIGEKWLGLQPGTAPLTSNQEWDDIPFQRWYRFKEAFSPLFVRDALSEATALLGRKPETCLDPFGGSGTTALTAQFLGVRPTTIEVNPFLADLIRAKLTSYDVGDLLVAHTALMSELAAADSYRLEAQDLFAGAPKTFVEPGVNERWIFDYDIARRIWSYRHAFERLVDRSSARLFRVLLGSVLLGVSNVVVNGKGRRYRQPSRRSVATVELIDERFQSALEKCVEDISRFATRRCPTFTVLRGDARVLIPRADEADVVLFSPPYPNSFDYTDIYNVELWALGYLASASDNRALRTSTLRSHVQIKRDYSIAALSPSLRRTIAALESVRDELWNNDLPAMIGAYFSDIVQILRSARSRLTKHGVIMMVVGDSRYAGIQIDVAKIVRELLPEEKLRVRSVTRVRSMRTSAQQGGDFELSESLLVIDQLREFSPAVRPSAVSH
jgi:hypothetical protein